MGLVEYSESESEGEGAPPQPTPAAAPKKAFHKLLDRSSGSGKIVVSLPAASNNAPDADAADEQPPAKRTKTLGGSRFSGLGSFLPPPKRARAAEKPPGEAADAGLRLKTGAEPAFERAHGVAVAEENDAKAPTNSRGRAGPTIPEGQKPEEEVALVGKPLQFKPLSVARKKKVPTKDKKKDVGSSTARGAPHAAEGQPSVAAAAPEPPKEEEKKRKKISLFSMADDEPPSRTPTVNGPSGTYEPVFTLAPGLSEADRDYNGDESAVTSAYPSTTAPVEQAAYQYSQQQPHQQPPTQPQQPHDFASLAATLTPAERRELFGRNPHPTSSSSTSTTSSPFLPASSKVITFDMEREYAHNEALRMAAAAGGVEGSVGPQHNPVRAIAPGKHSLRQVVNMAQSNQGALEESFARAKSSQRDAAGRYGWK